MFNPSDLQVPPPTKWQDFETLCWDLWRSIWNDPTTQKNGREGQKQHGVDIYGRPNLGLMWAGVQAKGKDNFLMKALTERELVAEVDKAKLFEPKLSQFIIATTGPKDAKLEKIARLITEKHLSEESFGVSVYGWTDILLRLEDYPEIFEKYFPWIISKKSESSHDDELYTLRMILKDFEMPTYKISSIARKAIRVARMRQDYESLWWLEYEMVSFGDKDARKRIFNEMSSHFSNSEIHRIERQIIESYINERACLSLEPSGNVLNKGEITGRSISEIESFIEHYSLEIKDEHQLINRRASLAAIVGNHREILKRIEQRIYNFLVVTEGNILGKRLH